MAQINFPTATSNGQTFEADNGVIYTYVGTPPNGFWSGSFQATGLTTLDARFLKLDSSNDPVTGGLDITGQTNIGGSSGLVGSKLNIFNGSDNQNIFGITGADESTEYAALGVSPGNAVITGGGIGTTDTGIIFRTAEGK